MSRQGPRCSLFHWVYLIWFGFFFAARAQRAGAGGRLALPPQFNLTVADGYSGIQTAVVFLPTFQRLYRFLPIISR